MKDNIMLLLVAFMVISAAGCVQDDMDDKEIERQENNQVQDVRIINFDTDKETYGSHENLKATIGIDSTTKSEISARLLGIKPYSYPHIDKTERLSLSEGENQVVLNVNTPHCTSGCGGVYPGPYDITIQLILNNTVVAESTKTIELVS